MDMMNDEEWIKEFYQGWDMMSYTDKQLQMLNKFAPNCLYQYRSGSKQDFENIKNKVVWTSKVSQFNDPYDCDFNGRFFEDEYGTLVERVDEAVKTCYDSMKKTVESLKENFTISCFSRFENSLLMWSHYANKHKGICICYATEDLSATKELLLPVLYETEKVNPYIKTCDGKIEMNQRIREILVRKSLEWKYEHEWRLVHVIPEGFPRMEIDKDKGMVIKNVFPKRIILGARFPKNKMKDVYDCGKVLGINVTRMKLCNNSFKLEEIDIENDT